MRVDGEASKDRQIQTRGLYIELSALRCLPGCLYKVLLFEKGGKGLHLFLVLGELASLYFRRLPYQAHRPLRLKDARPGNGATIDNEPAIMRHLSVNIKCIQCFDNLAQVASLLCLRLTFQEVSFIKVTS
jgi:hypothetical protein